MSIDNFDNCLVSTLKWEGGYSDHPSDPGGATNRGVTQARYNEYRKDVGLSSRAVKHLTEAELQKIYLKYYWDVVKGDDLPLGLDLAVFDFAVNSGPSRSAKYLQRIVGAQEDGKIGPMTLETVEGMSIPYVIQALCDERLAFVKRLRIYKTFGRGWKRRINNIKKVSLGMVKTGPVYPDSPSILQKVFMWLRRYL